MNKYNVTIIDKHGITDVVEVYADSLDQVPQALDTTHGDDYQSIESIE